MSFQSRASSGFVRLATEIKSVRAQLNAYVPPSASETAKGIVELATTAEAVTGTDTERAVTPAGVKAAIPVASTTVAGIVELATNAETSTGSDTTRAVTPAGLKSVIDNLVAGAPGLLDTLDEIAAAIGDDANFAANVMSSLGGKQPLDADLTSFAALASAADKMAYATGPQAWALTDLTPFARSILDDTNAAGVRGTISVYSQAEIGDPETDFVALIEAALV